MKSYLRENPTIAFGLGLPLLLVIVFLLISGIPSLLVKPPQYDVVYATGYGNYQNTVQISVVEQKAQVTYYGDMNSNRQPRLWRYNSKTGAVRELSIIFPPNIERARGDSASSEEVKTPIVLDIPDLEGLTIDSSSIAPDGYEFNGGEGRYSRNVFGGMFYGTRYGHEAVLTKKGRSIRLPNSSRRYYSGDTHFIGWVVTQ